MLRMDILYVEDNEDLNTLTLNMIDNIEKLLSGNFWVEVWHSYGRPTTKTYDLAILDFHDAQERTGRDWLRNNRSYMDAVPLIGVSGDPYKWEETRMCNVVLAKPYSQSDLHLAILQATDMGC